MKTAAILALAAVLGTSPLAQAAHIHGGRGDRVAHQAHARRHHARQADKIVEAVAKRGDGSVTDGRTRIVRRGAGGCRAKGSNSTASANTASTAAAASATTEVANNAQLNAQQATTAAAASASPSPSASSGSSSGSSGGGTTNSGANSGSLTPKGIKAGVSAGDTLGALGDHIGWWYNWAPNDDGTTSAAGALFVPMLWGAGSADSTDATRMSQFKALSSVPEWIIGFEEPDCATGSGSAGMSIAESATVWNQLMAPKGAAGSLLLSPSMCKQMAEDGWLAQFQTQITRDFDILNLHINKNSMAGVKADIDYYYNRYNKPIWVTEFACVDDVNGFTPCTDQGQINQFISDIVDLFEADSRVYAYAYSNGYGLGNVWPMWNNGQMTASGQAYLSAISKYH